MSQHKEPAVPALRFPEFTEEYQHVACGEILKKVSSPVSVEAEKLYTQIGIRSHGKGIFHKEPVTGSELGNKRVFWVKEDLLTLNIVFAWEQAVAKTGTNEKGLIASHRFPMFKGVEEDTIDYLLSLFLTKRGKYLLELASPGGAGRNKTLGQKEFERLKVFFPKRKERIAVSKFLQRLNEKIEQLSKKKSLLDQYKKGITQKLFSQKIRFKNDKGDSYPDWKEVHLGDVFQRVTRKNNKGNKNVLTISAQRGLINQEKFFNKSVAAKDVSGYYLLKKGEFAYNKSYSKGYPMGVIKKLKNYDEGVVSTLYICFKILDGFCCEYFEHFFDHGGINRELHKIATEGARNHGLLNVSIVEFFNDIKFKIPSEIEQRKISAFLNSIDQKIKDTSRQLELTQTYKQGLLQQMFI